MIETFQETMLTATARRNETQFLGLLAKQESPNNQTAKLRYTVYGYEWV